MTLPAYPNQIKISNLRTQTGSAACNLNSYHAGAGIVPSGAYGAPKAVRTLIPSSGQISLGNFHSYPYEWSGHECLWYWYVYRNNLFRSTAGYNSGPGSYYDIGVYPGDNRFSADHYNSYSHFNSTARFYFYDTGNTDIYSNTWTAFTCILGRNSGSEPYWRTTPTLGGTDYSYATAGMYFTVSQVSRLATTPPNSIYADWQWNNWTGGDNIGCLGFSTVLPGSWLPQSFSAGLIANSGDYYVWDQPPGTMSILMGNAYYNANMLNALGYATTSAPGGGVYTIQGDNTWYWSSAYFIVINTSQYTTSHRVNAAYDYSYSDKNGTYYGRAGTGFFAGNGAIQFIMYNSANNS